MTDKENILIKLNQLSKGTMMEQLQIVYLAASDGCVKAKMPVNERTKQPDGILHGGANLALAETLAGLGSAIITDLKKFDVRGAQVSGNHVGSVSEGWVYAEASIIHRGKVTHVWDVVIKDENDRMISTCRLTNFIIPK